MITEDKDGNQVDDLILVAKAAISPADIRPGGELRPEAARRILSLVMGSDFLQKVTTRVMRTLKADGAVIDIAKRSLRRTAPGKEPTAAEKTGVESFAYLLNAEDCDLYADVNVSWLRDNQSNPNLLRELEMAFSKRIQGELVDLAFNGVGSGTDPFLKLNKGWIEIAKSNRQAKKVDIDPKAAGKDGWIDALEAVIAAQDEQFLAQSVLLMNPKDADRYAFDLGKFSKDKGALADDPAAGVIGYEVERAPFMPRDHVLFTPLKNLIFGLNQGITLHRQFNPRKKVIEYSWHLYADFEIAAKQAVTLGRPKPPATRV